MSIFDGDLISRFNFFAKSATEVYVYYNLKNVYENREFNADNSIVQILLKRLQCCTRKSE
jgi:hypothetical protein